MSWSLNFYFHCMFSTIQVDYTIYQYNKYSKGIDIRGRFLQAKEVQSPPIRPTHMLDTDSKYNPHGTKTKPNICACGAEFRKYTGYQYFILRWMEFFK